MELRIANSFKTGSYSYKPIEFKVHSVLLCIRDHFPGAFLRIANRGRRSRWFFTRGTSTPAWNPMRLKAAERKCLLLQQFRSQIDLGGINSTGVEFLGHIVAIEEAEQLVGGPVVQLLSRIGVNVIHHQVDFS